MKLGVGLEWKKEKSGGFLAVEWLALENLEFGGVVCEFLHLVLKQCKVSFLHL